MAVTLAVARIRLRRRFDACGSRLAERNRL